MPKPLTLKQLFLRTLFAGALYSVLFLMRPIWMRPVCGAKPEACLQASVNGFDQLAFHYGSVFADFCSNVVQNGVGLIAFLLPWLSRLPKKTSIRLNLSLLLITAWNGVLIEIVRALVQRPRPLVYASPITDGSNIHQYTSFYSGHTSFVTLATLFTWIWYRDIFPERRKALIAITVFGPLISVLTGVLRVVGGRHYPTDVIGGLVFGAVVCLVGVRSFRQFDRV